MTTPFAILACAPHLYICSAPELRADVARIRRRGYQPRKLRVQLLDGTFLELWPGGMERHTDRSSVAVFSPPGAMWSPRWADWLVGVGRALGDDVTARNNAVIRDGVQSGEMLAWLQPWPTPDGTFDPRPGPPSCCGAA